MTKLRPGVSKLSLFLNQFFKSHALRLDDDVDGKIATCMSNEWKEELEEKIDEMLTSENWLQKLKWLKGEIKELPLKQLRNAFHHTSHYPETDIYLAIANTEVLVGEIKDEIDLEEDWPEDKFMVLRINYLQEK